MRRKVVLIIFVSIFFVGAIFTVNGDAGPKPSLEIIVENAPESFYYLDLLIDYDLDNLYQFIEDDEVENIEMFEILKNYKDGEWRPALATGTRVPLHGELTGIKEGESFKHSFTYMGVPDRFKIIIVTSDKEIIVSENILERKSFNSKAYFDCNTGIIKERSYIISTILQFIPTFSATLLIEGIILHIFGFSIKINWKPFITINLITQILLTIVIGFSMYRLGIFLALLAYFFMEWLILIIESVSFSKYLKEHTKKRRVFYAITANILSFIAGLLITLYINIG